MTHIPNPGASCGSTASAPPPPSEVVPPPPFIPPGEQVAIPPPPFWETPPPPFQPLHEGAPIPPPPFKEIPPPSGDDQLPQPQPQPQPAVPSQPPPSPLSLAAEVDAFLGEGEPVSSLPLSTLPQQGASSMIAAAPPIDKNDPNRISSEAEANPFGVTEIEVPDDNEESPEKVFIPEKLKLTVGDVRFLFLLFNLKIITYIHYYRADDVEGVFRCCGTKCPLCTIGNKARKTLFLPVIEAATSMPYYLMMGTALPRKGVVAESLFAQIFALAKGNDFAKTAVKIEKIDKKEQERFLVTAVNPPAGLLPTSETIQQWVAYRKQPIETLLRGLLKLASIDELRGIASIANSLRFAEGNANT